MMRGCIRPVVPPHLHKLAFRTHPAMLAALPASVDLRETGLVAVVKDQGGSSGCEGHACSGATETSLALAGTPLGYVPSEAGLYRGGRSVERARRAGATLPRLKDDGAMTEDVLVYMATTGVRPRLVDRTSDGRNSDVEMATVNDEETLGDLEVAAEKLIVGPYAVDPHASDAEYQVKAALAARIPVRVDAFVDSVFEDWSPSQAPAPAPNESDSRGGGHAVYIVGYAPGFYILRNSWGSAGDNGDYRVSPAWLRASWGIYPWVARRTL